MKTFYKEEELIDHIKSKTPSFYFSSRTSTVIPYDKIESYFEDIDGFELCDLSKLPSDYELLPNNNLKIRGPLSWKDARIFLRSKGRDIMTSPTEDLALITAGAATSCTGERCFGFGNLRSQIVSIKYLNYKGEEQTLKRENKINKDFVQGLEQYQNDFNHYQDYKNAPYPRFETETDLMIGTEGQLGVITEIEIETTEMKQVHHMFLLAPKWEDNFKPHLEIFKKIQAFRKSVFSCELIDHNAFSYLAPEDRLGKDEDVLFLEVDGEHFEEFYEKFLARLELTAEDKIFEISEENFHKVRASIPRAVFEANSKAGVIKMGTDVQVDAAHFEKLIDFYAKASKVGVKYNLFGHFGDAHLHFNFMPLPPETEKCSEYFLELYDKVLEWKGSPFAEHGIGIIKQPYIKKFIGENQSLVFKGLKEKLDPFAQFFPKGFMNL